MCDNTYDHISVYGTNAPQAGPDMQYRNIDGHSIIYATSNGNSILANVQIYGESDSFPRPTVDGFTSSFKKVIINGTSIIEETDYTSIGSYLDDYDGKFYSLDSTETYFTCINCDSVTVYSAPVVSNAGITSYENFNYRNLAYTHWGLMYNKKLYGSLRNNANIEFEQIVEYDLLTATSTTWATSLNLTSRNSLVAYLKFAVDRVDSNNINFYLVRGSYCVNYLSGVNDVCPLAYTINDTFYELDLQSRSFQR